MEPANALIPVATLERYRLEKIEPAVFYIGDSLPSEEEMPKRSMGRIEMAGYSPNGRAYHARLDAVAYLGFGERKMANMIHSILRECGMEYVPLIGPNSADWSFVYKNGKLDKEHVKRSIERHLRTIRACLNMLPQDENFSSGFTERYTP